MFHVAFLMLSVGEILKKQREKLGIDLQEIEEQIKVRKKLLQAIEENNWSSFTSKIYISGIIKNYSVFLGLDPIKTLAFFRRDYEKQETIKFKRKVGSDYLTPETKKIVFLSIIFLTIIFFSYFAYQLNLFLSPPKVTIIQPKITLFKKEAKIKIVGKTEKDAAITIFGDRIYQDKNGIFEYIFPLKKGINQFTMEAVGANGKKTAIKKIFINQ